MTRRLLPLAVVLTALTVGASPASAQPVAIAFTGVWHEECWGCGSAHGWADFTFFGSHPGAAHAEFDAYSSAVPPCTIYGTASGSISGPLDLQFNWVRSYGSLAVFTVSGDASGAGTAVWVPSGPLIMCTPSAHSEGSMVKPRQPWQLPAKEKP